MKRFLLLLMVLFVGSTGCAIRPVVMVGSDRVTRQPVYAGQGYTDEAGLWMSGILRNLSDCDLSVILPRDFQIYQDGQWQDGPMIKIPAGMNSADDEGIPLQIRVKPTLPGLEYRVPYRFHCSGRSRGWQQLPFQVNGRQHDAYEGFDWEMYFRQ